MLTVRVRQLQMLEEESFRSFAHEIVPWIKTALAGLRAMPDADAVTAITEAVQRARSYGLTSREDLTRFFQLAARYGLDFETLPGNEWMLSQLTDAAVTQGSRRLELLLDQLDRREQIEARNQARRAAFEQSFAKPR
jgi:hypothetical protein